MDLIDLKLNQLIKLKALILIKSGNSCDATYQCKTRGLPTVWWVDNLVKNGRLSKLIRTVGLPQYPYGRRPSKAGILELFKSTEAIKTIINQGRL